MSLNPNGKWHQGTQDSGHIGASHLQGLIKPSPLPPSPIPTLAPQPCLRSPLSPPCPSPSPLPPASVTLLPCGLGLVFWTKAVPPQAIGDGRNHGEPGQVGQQEQGSQLVDGVPDQCRAHHQPEEQQQVQQGLGRGRAVRQAALGTGPRPFCSTLDLASQVPSALCMPQKLREVCPTVTCPHLIDLLCYQLLGPGGLIFPYPIPLLSTGTLPDRGCGL